MNIGHIPAKTARLSPQREALIDIPNDRRVTFGELDVQFLLECLCLFSRAIFVGPAIRDRQKDQ